MPWLKVGGGRGMAQSPSPKYAPGCACLNGHSILVFSKGGLNGQSLKPFNKCFQKVWFVNTVFFIKSFIDDKIYKYVALGA